MNGGIMNNEEITSFCKIDCVEITIHQITCQKKKWPKPSTEKQCKRIVKNYFAEGW